MDTEAILAALESQLDKIDRAIAALRGSRVTSGGKKRGHGNKGRRLSAAARKRIGAAMKKRWAERKKVKV